MISFHWIWFWQKYALYFETNEESKRKKKSGRPTEQAGVCDDLATASDSFVRYQYYALTQHGSGSGSVYMYIMEFVYIWHVVQAAKGSWQSEFRQFRCRYIKFWVWVNVCISSVYLSLHFSI